MCGKIGCVPFGSLVNGSALSQHKKIIKDSSSDLFKVCGVEKNIKEENKSEFGRWFKNRKRFNSEFRKCRRNWSENSEIGQIY